MRNNLPPQDSQTKISEGDVLKFLQNSEIAMIDEALSTVGDYGEVRLVVQKGRLRFVVMQNSHDALRWQPGSIISKESGRKAGGPRRQTSG